jgi:hypothetical protein
VPFFPCELWKTIFEVHDAGDDVEFYGVTFNFVSAEIRHILKAVELQSKVWYRFGKRIKNKGHCYLGIFFVQ